ncbi:MAG: hypothetical protein ACJ8KU_00080 [Chthoniobacterales bacterium]
MPGSQLWLVIARPDHLHTALIAADALKHRFPGGCHLIREESEWWQRASWQQFRDRFASVHALARLNTCRGLADLPRLYRDTAARQRALGALPIDPQHDTLCVLAGALAIGNAAASAHRDVFKILRASQKSFNDLKRPIDRRHYRFTTSGWLQNRVVDPLNRVERTVNLKPRFNPGGDGVRIGRLQRDPEEIYDVIIVENETGDVPRGQMSRVIGARPPRIAELSWLQAAANRVEKQRVVFFGTPFILVKNLEPGVYLQSLQRCFDFLRLNYGDTCELIYRPHPAETTETSLLNLAGFRIENDREAAELYFLRHFAAIEAVYSVSSSVSRVALHNGLDAYAFWPCFPFSETAAHFFAKLMGDVPPEFLIRDLDQPPVKYASTRANASGLTFGQALNRALDMRPILRR